MNEKLKELLVNEAFAKRVENLKTAEELKIALDEFGIEMSVEQIVDWGRSLAEEMGIDKKGELSADDLDNVSGGSILGLICSGVTVFVVSIYLGTLGC